MSTAIINIKTTYEEKRQAQATAASLGMPLSTILKGFLKQFVRTKTISFSARDEEPTQYLLDVLKQADKDIAEDKTIEFANDKEMFAYLDKEIADEKRTTS